MLATAAVVAVSSWSCGSTAPEPTPQVAAIVVNPATPTLVPNAQLPLQAQVQDESGAMISDAAVIWTVQDPKIVSVSADGVVTALAVGTTQVAASSLGKSGIAIVTVRPATVTPGPVATVTVTGPSDRVRKGATMQLAASAADANGNPVPQQGFFWSSSNTNIATVSASGLVTGVRPGKATITARTAATGGKSGSLQIEVR